jgi:hypothetical protein
MVMIHCQFISGTTTLVRIVSALVICHDLVIPEITTEMQIGQREKGTACEVSEWGRPLWECMRRHKLTSISFVLSFFESITNTLSVE